MCQKKTRRATCPYTKTKKRGIVSKAYNQKLLDMFYEKKKKGIWTDQEKGETTYNQKLLDMVYGNKKDSIPKNQNNLPLTCL